MTATSTSRAGGRFWLILAAAVIIVVLIVGGAGNDGPPYDPRSVNPDGARGIVETLERLGAQVDLDAPLPSAQATTALVLRDRLVVEDEDILRDWVVDGGVLVVADLSLELAAGISGLGGSQPRRGTCTISALDEVQELSARGSSLAVSGHESCFGDGQRAFIVAEQVGRGTVVTLGSPDVFTNAALDEKDNAVLAAALLMPAAEEAHVAVLGPSVVDFGEESLIDLVPTRVWNSIWQLMAAFLLYALYRARRLGGVVAEPVPVHIEGSELVLKAGVLSERARDPASAASVLRNDLLQRARQALAAAPTEDDEALIQRIATRIDQDLDEVQLALLSPVGSEDDLTRIALQLNEIDTRLFEQKVTP